MNTASTLPQLDARSGVLVVDGYGVRIVVERGHLRILDGAGRNRRERRLAKVGHGIHRLVVLGHTGTISLEAFRWLDRVGIHFVQLDRDGKILTASANEAVGNARLRRAQVVAHGGPARLEIVTSLLGAKLAGQARNLRTHLCDVEAADRVQALQVRLAGSSSVIGAREIEAIAALDYFSSWRHNVGLRWVTRDRSQVPQHWLAFAGRRSGLANRSNNRATDPVNAILNYLYALGEIECRRACLILGLDPGLGFLHHDTQTRDSLAVDLIEAIRPDIDAYLLRLTETQIFTAGDFHETENGHCRLLPPLTHQLATSLTQWQQSVAPWAEHVAHTLADTSPYKMRKAKPLSSAVRVESANAHSANRRKSPRPRAGVDRTRPVRLVL